MITESVSSHLYETFRKPLHSFIAKRVSDPGTVEDLVHDVFVKIHSRIEAVKEPEKLTAWIYQIAKNTIVDFYRKKKTVIDVTEDLLLVDQERVSDAAERLTPAIRTMIAITG